VETISEEKSTAFQEHAIRVWIRSAGAIESEAHTIPYKRSSDDPYFAFADHISFAWSQIHEGRLFGALALLEQLASYYQARGDYGQLIIDGLLRERPGARALEEQIGQLHDSILDAPILIRSVVPAVAPGLCGTTFRGETFLTSPSLPELIPARLEDYAPVPNPRLSVVLSSLDVLADEAVTKAANEGQALGSVPYDRVAGQDREYVRYLAYYYDRHSAERLARLDGILSNIELDSLVAHR
jgi:hypothetical protein